MNKPKMILFDYGQTLINQIVFDPLKGTEAVLREASNNPYKVSAEEVQALANDLSKDIRRYGDDFEKNSLLEVHMYVFQNYLYEYFDIELTKSPEEVEKIFAMASQTLEPTKNIVEFLSFLNEMNIRTGVVSNISFSGKMLKSIINTYIPSNNFEFIIASSEYAFRKPHKRIFELALRKAKLEPCDVWYCGDNAVYDVDGAADCGIFPVWYKGAIEERNKSIPKEKSLEINDWNKLVEVLK